MILPSTSTSARSASRMASSTSWVTSRTAGWWRAHRSCSRACMRVPGQRVQSTERLVGSITCGSRTSARARATRCASPPDRVTGQAQALHQPYLGERIEALLPERAAYVGTGRSPRSTLGCTRCRGISLGSWKTTARRCGDHVAAVVGIEPAEDAKQGALTGAAAAEEGHELVWRDRDVKAAEHVPASEGRVTPLLKTASPSAVSSPDGGHSAAVVGGGVPVVRAIVMPPGSRCARPATAAPGSGRGHRRAGRGWRRWPGRET